MRQRDQSSPLLFCQVLASGVELGHIELRQVELSKCVHRTIECVHLYIVCTLPTSAVHIRKYSRWRHHQHCLGQAPFDQYFSHRGASATCRQQWTFVSMLLRDVPSGGASAIQGHASAND